MDLKPCPFCGGKAKQVDICATDFSSANAGGSYIICQSCLACSAVMFGEKAGLSELWNRRALPPEPRTCETCATGCLPNERVYVNPDVETPCPGWTHRSPQSADVETARSKIELAIKFGLPIDARMALRDALAALDRIAGVLRG